MTTNYVNSFIAASPDCRAVRGEEPKPGSFAALQLALLRDRPYGYTSDDLLFEVHMQRSGIAAADCDAERENFFSKSRACLRTSPLVKQHGWGLHHDGNARIAAYGMETEDYRRLTATPGLKQVKGMRSRRA